MIRARFKVGTLKLQGDANRLGAAVDRLKGDAREAQLRSAELERAQRRLRQRLLNLATRAFLNG